MSEVPPDALTACHEGLGRLYALWNGRRAGRRMPARADFDVIEFRPWMGNLMLLEVTPSDLAFRYRVYGSRLAEEFGRDLTGKTTAALRADARRVVEGEYAIVCEQRRPLFLSHWRSATRTNARFCKLVLPFSADGEIVDRLLVGVYRLDSAAAGGSVAARQAFVGEAASAVP